MRKIATVLWFISIKKKNRIRGVKAVKKEKKIENI